MGKKGDKASKAGIAMDIYAQGKSLDEISGLLDVSVTSLSRWKAETKDPNKDLDEWELARQGHRDFIDELRALFREQLRHIKDLKPEERQPGDFDMLSKSAAIVRKWDDIERENAAKMMEGSQPVEIDRPAIFLETLEWIALKLKETDPEGLKVLARNFDALVIQFKTEIAQER